MPYDNLNCGNCEHFVPNEGDESRGQCLLLSDVDMETEEDMDAGAMDIFMCNASWYCKSHSDNETQEQIDDDAIDSETPPTPQYGEGERPSLNDMLG